jgi:hypothetical protein
MNNNNNKEGPTIEVPEDFWSSDSSACPAIGQNSVPGLRNSEAVPVSLSKLLPPPVWWNLTQGSLWHLPDASSSPVCQTHSWLPPPWLGCLTSRFELSPGCHVLYILYKYNHYPNLVDGAISPPSVEVDALGTQTCEFVSLCRAGHVVCPITYTEYVAWNTNTLY